MRKRLRAGPFLFFFPCEQMLTRGELPRSFFGLNGNGASLFFLPRRTRKRDETGPSPFPFPLFFLERSPRHPPVNSLPPFFFLGKFFHLLFLLLFFFFLWFFSLFFLLFLLLGWFFLLGFFFSWGGVFFCGLGGLFLCVFGGVSFFFFFFFFFGGFFFFFFLADAQSLKTPMLGRISG